jgi:hypothetical protein
MIQKFEKTLDVIEAVQWTGDNFEEIKELVKDSNWRIIDKQPKWWEITLDHNIIDDTIMLNGDNLIFTDFGLQENVPKGYWIIKTWFKHIISLSPEAFEKNYKLR